MNPQQRRVLLDRGYLGKGTFGTVFQCTDTRTHVTYALKAMDLRTLRMRSEFQESRLHREVQVMRKLSHPFIVRLQDVIFTEDALFLVMELVIGVDLFDTIVAKGGFDENGAKFIFCQLCLALDYIHDQGILHRDVKPENILLRGPSSPSMISDRTGCIPSGTWIKLVDFGLSKLQGAGDVNSFVGTPRYIAPEVITVGEEEKRRRTNGDSQHNGNAAFPTYSTPADCFSAGICLFVMMANCFPKFQNGAIAFEGSNGRAAQFSPEARDIITRLTDPDPSKRMNMKQALAHPWLAPAKEIVERLIRSETSIVKTLSKVPPSMSNSNSTSASVTGTSTRPLKRPFIMANHQPSFPATFPTVVPSSSWQTNSPMDVQQQLGMWTPSTNNGLMSGQVLVTEINREWRSALQSSSHICSNGDVRSAIRAMMNMLVQSERVVLNCAQTSVSVMGLIPDVRDCLLSSSPSNEAVRQMLRMIKEWIDSLKQEASTTLQQNHQILVMMGNLVQQISLSPDVIAESIAGMSVSGTNPSTNNNLRCLSHLERIESLLRVHESFWGRMDAALGVLQQRATIIDNMSLMVTTTPSLEERFLQKLDEYFALWQSAAVLSQQFQSGSSAPSMMVEEPPTNFATNGMNTVVVMNETSPNSSLESYEGDI